MFNKFLNRNSNQDIPAPKGKSISLLNQKGGVGKTTMAFNIAHALANSGKDVLCIDMDPQANLTLLFGLDHDREYNIYHLLMNNVRELKQFHSPIVLSDVLETANSSKNPIDVIPAGQELSGFELSISGVSSPRQLVLKKFIEKNALKERYDYIIIDGPPTLGLLVVNILCATDGVMVPFQPDQFSRKGLTHFHSVLEDIDDMGIIAAPKVLGYIPNLVDGRRKQANTDFETIKDDLGSEMIFDPFPNKVQMVKSSAQGKSVYDFNAGEYKELQHKFDRMADHIEHSFH